MPLRFFERVKFLLPGHDNGERPQNMLHANGLAMLRENIGKPAIGHRALVEIGANEHNAALLQPAIHLRARKPALGFLAAEQSSGAVNC